MKAQRIFLHCVAVAALSTMCMAQGLGQQQGMGQQGGPQGSQGQMGNNYPGSMSTGTDTNNMSKSPDQSFIMKAAQGGMAEVQLGTLAKQNGGSDAVKDFGNKMVTDHSQANSELQQIAQRKGIKLPSGLDSKDKKTSKMLESKQGADFDKAYVHDMVKDHETDVAEFRKEAQNGKDPDVKAWAQKTLPTLEQHLATAKQLQGQVGGETSKKSGAMASQQH